LENGETSRTLGAASDENKLSNKGAGARKTPVKLRPTGIRKTSAMPRHVRLKINRTANN